MLFSDTTYIGIDPTAGEKPFVYAAVDHDLSIIALGHGDIDDTLAFSAGQRRALVAVSAPQQPNIGLMKDEEFRNSISPRPNPGRWENFRYAEFLLRQHNIHIPQTPSSESDCPNWMRMGFLVFNRLSSIGYKPYQNGDIGDRMFIEVYPHACFTVLLNLIPFLKNSLEGRLQRQLVLYDKKMDVPDPMRIFEEITRHRLLSGVLPLGDLFSPGELDALIAAYTAWMVVNKPDETILLGDNREGQVVVPASKLSPIYQVVGK